MKLADWIGLTIVLGALGGGGYLLYQLRSSAAPEPAPPTPPPYQTIIQPAPGPGGIDFGQVIKTGIDVWNTFSPLITGKK
jgi:hypothetical protein